MTTNENPRRYSLKTFRTTFVVEEGAPDPAINNSREMFHLAQTILSTLDADQEHFIVLALNTKNRVYGYKNLHTGGTQSAVVDVRLVAKTAIALEATSIAIIHNHPSGVPTPSAEDRAITSRIYKGMQILGMRLLDHIIVGDNDYFSFADAGILDT